MERFDLVIYLLGGFWKTVAALLLATALVSGGLTYSLVRSSNPSLQDMQRMKGSLQNCMDRNAELEREVEFLRLELCKEDIGVLVESLQLERVL